METDNKAGFDLDEDLFGFDSADEIFGTPATDEEDLEAIFAEFQAQEEAEAALRDELGNEFPEEELDAPSPASAPAPSAPALRASEDDEVAPALPKPEPAAAKQPEPKASRPSGAAVLASKSALVILLSVTVLNGFVALVTLRNTASMRDSVLQAQKELDETANTMRADARDEAVRYLGATTPIVPPDSEDHPTFARAQEHIAAGEYAQARQRVYALLAVVDRLEEGNREVVEARAQFLIAQATHLETLARMEGLE